MANRNYDAIERTFTDLLDSVSTGFSEEELREIREFLDATEYGLALQTFIDVVVEEQKRIPHHAVTLCEELARLMDLTQEVDLQAMRNATTS